METPRPPTTCSEAATFFYERADKTPYDTDRQRLIGAAEVLEALGNTPVTPALLEAYDFTRV